jgi:hypothetical protein
MNMNMNAKTIFEPPLVQAEPRPTSKQIIIESMFGFLLMLAAFSTTLLLIK